MKISFINFFSCNDYRINSSQELMIKTHNQTPKSVISMKNIISSGLGRNSERRIQIEHCAAATDADNGV